MTLTSIEKRKQSFQVVHPQKLGLRQKQIILLSRIFFALIIFERIIQKREDYFPTKK